MKRDLRDLETPEHGDGFWDDLRSRLGDQARELPLGARDRSMPRWLMAPFAAVVVLVVAFGATRFLTGDGVETGQTTSIPAPSTTGTTQAPPTSDPDAGPVAPWQHNPVTPEDAPRPILDAWFQAENAAWCSALTPSDPELLADYTARTAEFSGGWAAAWDGPALRSAFGIAGTSVVADVELALRWPSVVEYSDGSVLGFGLAPSRVGFDDVPRQLGEIVIPTEGCLYQVWSELGDDHLVSLVESLRFVEGLEGGPIDPLETEVRDGGAAPWTLPGTASLPVRALQLRADAGRTGPILFPTTVEFPDDAIRSANLGEWGIAWDVPGQPGHDTLNYPCEECGRGVIGYSEVGDGFGTGPAVRPLRIQYNDGSVVDIGYYVGDDAIGPERPQFTATDTGNPVLGGYQARVFDSSTGEEYILWSHLGLDHLLGLVDGLRPVA